MKILRLLAVLWSCIFSTIPSLVYSDYVVHKYVGKQFDSGGGFPPGGPPPPQVDKVTGYISVDLTTIDTQTALVDVSAYVGDFWFTDGFQTLSMASGADLDDILIKTDSSGNIEEWLIDIHDYSLGTNLNTDFDPLDTDGSSDSSYWVLDLLNPAPGYFVFVENTLVSQGKWSKTVAKKVIYDFTGTVTDAGIIAGVSASIGDRIIGEFAYDTSTADSNPADPSIGDYDNLGIIPPIKITLPTGSLTFGSDTGVQVTVATKINISGGMPDPTTPGNNIDHDIELFLKSGSTALATDALPTTIDLNDFDPVTGAFSSFSIQNGPAGDPIVYSIDTLTIRPPLMIDVNSDRSDGLWRRNLRLK